MTRLWGALALVGLLLAGCGGSVAPTPTAEPPPKAAAPTTAMPLPQATVSASPTLPGPLPSSPTATPSLPGQAVTFRTEDGVEIAARLFGAGEVGVLLLPTGLAGTSQESWHPFAQAVADQGFAALAVDFRGCGASGGRLVEDHLILDARAAVAFLHARGVERLVCIGASLGGTTCLRLAADAEIEGVAALSSLMSAGPTNQVTEQELPGLGMPSLFAYGNRDAPQVRMEMARMHRAAGLPKDLMVLDGAAHGAELLDAPQGEELRGRLLGLVAGIAAPPHVANLPTHPTATPHASGGEEGVPALGDSWVRPADGMLMVYVPGGTFLIGSSEDDPEAVPDELPQHPVTVDSFWIDQTEVTNGQFVQFLNAHGNSGERGAKMIVLDRGYTRITQEDTQFSAPEVTLDRPVLMVTWYGAAAYCEWAGGRLPREAEWEYAARGPDSNIYPWGNEPPTCELANYGDCTRAPVRVGSRPAGASWCGALDMAGNVWEWVTDWFAPYSGLPEENPAGPATGEVPVLRGGGWHSPRWELRTAYRQHEVATTGYNG